MPKNAADVLFEFFSESVPERWSEYDLISLVSSLDEIRIHLLAWRHVGRERDAEMFGAAVNRWLHGLYESFAGNGGLVRVNNGTGLSAGDQDLLKVLSEKLDLAQPPMTDAERGKVSRFVDDVMGALSTDEDLPQELRLHILTLVAEIRRCLTEYDIQGDFKLTAAIERLMSALVFAGSRSSKPKVWQKVYDDWFQPLMVGFMIAAPQIALQIAALTTGTPPPVMP